MAKISYHTMPISCYTYTPPPSANPLHPPAPTPPPPYTYPIHTLSLLILLINLLSTPGLVGEWKTWWSDRLWTAPPSGQSIHAVLKEIILSPKNLFLEGFFLQINFPVPPLHGNCPTPVVVPPKIPAKSRGISWDYHPDVTWLCNGERRSFVSCYWLAASLVIECWPRGHCHIVAWPGVTLPIWSELSMVLRLSRKIGHRSYMADTGSL